MVQRGRLVERIWRPRKAEPDVVCKDLGRRGAKAVGEVVDPLKKDLKTSKGKIQD